VRFGTAAGSSSSSSPAQAAPAATQAGTGPRVGPPAGRRTGLASWPLPSLAPRAPGARVGSQAARGRLAIRAPSINANATGSAAGGQRSRAAGLSESGISRRSPGGGHAGPRRSIPPLACRWHSADSEAQASTGNGTVRLSGQWQRPVGPAVSASHLTRGRSEPSPALCDRDAAYPHVIRGPPLPCYRVTESSLSLVGVHLSWTSVQPNPFRSNVD
jgi:hypothetical protein